MALDKVWVLLRLWDLVIKDIMLTFQLWETESGVF